MADNPDAREPEDFLEWQAHPEENNSSQPHEGPADYA
jgi:hypothetical protein